MSEIIYESPNISHCGGILQLTESQSCNIPFVFTISSKDTEGNTVNYEITQSDVVEFIIKSDIKLLTPTIWKRYNNIKNNVAVLSLTSSDMKLLLGGKHYYLSAILHKDANKKDVVLIRKLEVYVQEVV